MTIARRTRTYLRGPVRTGLRQWQAGHHLPVGRREAGPPDYVGIGVQRCGTSWWHSLLEAHPRVARLGWGAKELHFFDSQWSASDPAALRETYAAHFRRRPGEVAGEWTPRYLYDPWAVPALMAAAPDVRLLVMLRDPVARFESGLKHELKTHGQPGPDAVAGAYARGLYAAQLAPLMRLVDPDRILVLQLEACQRERDRFLDQTFAFLGLDSFRPPGEGWRNQSARSLDVPAPLLEAVREGYRDDVARLAELVPGRVDTDLWKSLPT